MKYFVVDAFADKPFGGNPAGVCIAQKNISDETMQKIAAENNLSETAFISKTENGYNLRWFTPKFEIDLCGHATLASAFIVSKFIEPNAEKISFNTKSGIIDVEKNGNNFSLSFPVRTPQKIEITDEIINILGFKPLELYSERDLYAVVDKESDIINYAPNYNQLIKMSDRWLGIVLTAKGESCDFVSRCFCPELNIEDPVTGSTHCTLAPLWQEKLEKNEFTARQLSPRGGTLECSIKNDRVFISGKATLYMQGEIMDL